MALNLARVRASALDLRERAGAEMSVRKSCRSVASTFNVSAANVVKRSQLLPI